MFIFGILLLINCIKNKTVSLESNKENFNSNNTFLIADNKMYNILQISNDHGYIVGNVLE